MIDVHAYHGQGSSPSRMRYDCGNPGWITQYEDWQNELTVAAGKFVAAGYSLGGSKAWNRASDNVTLLRGSCRGHTKWIPRWPFIGQAWDVGLNPRLSDWVKAIQHGT